MKAPLLLLLFAGAFLAQSPTFDVASVKLFEGGATGPAYQVTADTLAIRGLSLKNCIQMAWHVPAVRIVAPAWMNEVQLEIVAKSAAPADEKQLQTMLRPLLAERLGLKAHTEERESPVYVLTLDNGGPKFHESTSEGPVSSNKKNTLTVVERISMPEFAMLMSQGFNRPFVDNTGLKGRYDVRLDIAPYLPQPSTDGGAAPIDPVGVMITALREQFGLKVESRKEDVEFVIVDHAERTPAGN